MFKGNNVSTAFRARALYSVHKIKWDEIMYYICMIMYMLFAVWTILLSSFLLFFLLLSEHFLVLLFVSAWRNAGWCHQPSDLCGSIGRTQIWCLSCSFRTMKSSSKMEMVSSVSLSVSLCLPHSLCLFLVRFPVCLSLRVPQRTHADLNILLLSMLHNSIWATL